MKNTIALINILNQVKYILSPSQKKKSIGVFFSMILLSMMELLGVSSIYPFLDAMLNVNTLENKWYSKWIFRLFPDISPNGCIFLFAILIILIFFSKNLLAIWFLYVQNKFAAIFQRDTSTLLLQTYLKRPYEFFVNTNSSIILRGMNSDVSSVYQVLLCAFQIVAECLTILMLAIFLFLTDWIIAIFAMLLAAMCFLLIVLGFKGRIKRAGREYRDAVARQNKCSYQAINGIKEITVMDRRNSFVREYHKAADSVAKATLVSSVIGACPDRILEGVCISGFIGIICIRIAMGIEIEEFIPVLGAFAMGAFKILPSVSKVSSRINTMVYHQFGLKGCYDNVKWARGLKDECYQSEETIRNDHLNFKRCFKENLSLSGVTWKYQNSTDNVIENLSLNINNGEAVAFIGSSGAGKTTLADIIMGLLKPQSGTVEVDGTDIFSIPHEWSRMISYVPQSVFLIDDTIRANIAFGIPEEKISDDQIWSALEQAQLREFVEGLPAGLDTIVGERGVKFSGGQRQRVAIARALYEDPEILVLDEATSALDTETETAVMESIDALQGHKTLVIVAHRLTTIRNCDRIYEIKDGKAVERNKSDLGLG